MYILLNLSKRDVDPKTYVSVKIKGEWQNILLRDRGELRMLKWDVK